MQCEQEAGKSANEEGGREGERTPAPHRAHQPRPIRQRQQGAYRQADIRPSSDEPLPYQSLNGPNAGFHLLSGRRIGGMDPDEGWLEAMKCHGLLDPEHHVIPRPALVVSQVVIETELHHPACSEQVDHLIRPIGSDPTRRSAPLIVQENSHEVDSGSGAGAS